MAAGQQADEQTLDRPVLADDDLLDLEQGPFEQLGVGAAARRRSADPSCGAPPSVVVGHGHAEPPWLRVSVEHIVWARGERTGRGDRPAPLRPSFGAGPVPSPGVRLLVVEDEVDLADALARGLRQQGYAVDVAYDGRGRLDHLALNAYDLVCLDLNLPASTAARCAGGCAPIRPTRPSSDEPRRAS